MSAPTAVLYRMVMDKHLCPYGLKAKDLLQRKGYRVEDHWLRTREETDAFKAAQQVATTPQVFIDGERIGWRSVEGSQVDCAGSVQFKDVEGGGTEVVVTMQYNPPAGKLGAMVAEPSSSVSLRPRACRIRLVKTWPRSKSVATWISSMATHSTGTSSGMASTVHTQ